MKHFIIGLSLIISTVPAFASSLCDKTIDTHLVELETIKYEGGLISAIEVLSLHADNLDMENEEKVLKGEISHQEAQDNREEIAKIRQCANLMGFRKI